MGYIAQYAWIRQSAQWRALCTEITDVNLSAFVYRLFHEDFPLIEKIFS